MKIKWKIFGFLLGFCGILLTILWLFQTVFLNDMYKLSRRNEIRSAVKTVEKYIDSQDLPVILDQIMEDKEILVTAKLEEIIAAKGRKEEVPPMPKTDQDRRNRIREETLTQTKEFVKADGSTLTLTFHALITPVNATVTTLRIQLTIITLIMIILAVLLALLIARHVAKPIEEINKSAKSLAKGDYDTRFQGNGFLEIEELSDTLNKAAGELSKVEGFRRELMTNIAHDLRTPLSLIYSYAEMMHDFPDEIDPEQTKIIMEEVSRLSSLVNDVFEISKLEAGNQTLNGATINLTEETGAVINRLEALLQSEGYSITFHADEDVWLFADRVKLAQVIYNLLTNAVNYAGEDRCVEVFQTAKARCVRIEVCDHGDGISEENLPYIWDRYYKVDKNHKRAVTGTGLGLSIVKKIIELHRGTYGVKSELGKGSTFWFEIPRT